MHEILTLQFGHFTNFIGTHFWNTQDSYFSYDLENAHEPGILHDVLYRSGITQKGIETYMPRLLVYDLKGGFGSIRKMNKLYEEDLSDNKEEIQQNQICLEIEEEAIINSTKDPNMMEIDFEEKYFDLDESVKMWSDFNKIYYHPKSINRVTQYQYDDEFMPFDVFSFGKNAYLDHQKEDENSFDENFRFFAEECDLIQGFQIITNLNDGFGGFSCGFVEQLIEEYPKKSVLTFGINETLIKSSNHSHYIKNNLNTILSLIQLTDMSSMFIPMNEPSNNILNNSEWNKFIHPNLDLSYHSSSIMSAVIESTILPFRTRNNFMSMDSFIDKMNWLRNTKIGSLGAVFPLPISVFGDINTKSLLPNNNIMHNFFEGQVKKKDNMSKLYSQSIILRGIPEIFHTESNKPKLFSNDIINEIFQSFESIKCPSNFKFSTSIAYPIPNSFPKYFNNNHLTIDGFIDSTKNPNLIVNQKSSTTNENKPTVKEIPMLTHFTISNKPKLFLDQYKEFLNKLDFKNLKEYQEGDKGIDFDEFLEIKESLCSLSEIYDQE
ncbi:13063_t:CDS:10 [Entrophospora sp. SA101]|nr:13063_t:CDS:10 [Entrophospora sp. SA101]CAJ0831753.1 4754_t:CDS:10 [Entrophospora sp. SA101]